MIRDNTNLYGKISLKSVEKLKQKETNSPKEVWEEIASHEKGSESSKQKGCPKSTFIGLCENQKIKGLHINTNKRHPSNSVNYLYAVEAITILNLSTTYSPKSINELWKRVRKLYFEKHKREAAENHNGQMDVVLALWDEGLIER